MIALSHLDLFFHLGHDFLIAFCGAVIWQLVGKDKT